MAVPSRAVPSRAIPSIAVPSRAVPSLSTATIVAHQGGWDEILLVVGPIVVIVGVLALVKRRVEASVGAADPPDPDGGPPGPNGEHPDANRHTDGAGTARPTDGDISSR